MSAAGLWRALADGSRADLVACLFRCLLAPFSLCYATILACRAVFYRWGMLRSYRLPRPVVSVGNITVGGTGKTPVTAWIARHMMQQGLRVAVISRGYGGSLEGQVAIVSDGQTVLLTPDQCGDEPYLLATTLPGLMVVIGSDRHRAGLLAMERLQPDLFLLDDGFQHLRLQRDLNILLLDCRRPFGNGWTLPSGLLREPQRAVGRANLVILTRCEPGRTSDHLAVPSCRTTHRLGGFYRLSDGADVTLDQLQQGVSACAGIADPAGFFSGLLQLGIAPIAPLALPDHESYSPETRARLGELLAVTGAAWLLTTEKDAVKLRGGTEEWLQRVVVARLELCFEDPQPLVAALESHFPCR